MIVAPLVGAFFMDLIIKEPEATVREEINPNSLKDKPKEVKEIVVEKKQLSKNIQDFDKRLRNVASPFDFNSVSLARKVEYTPTAGEMIANPTYNTVGKYLGVDTIHDWGQNYDKVKKLVDWAEEKTGKNDINSIMDFLNGALNAAPSFGMNHKKIDQLYLYARLSTGGNK